MSHQSSNGFLFGGKLSSGTDDITHANGPSNQFSLAVTKLGHIPPSSNHAIARWTTCKFAENSLNIKKMFVDMIVNC